jgi:hypothetical protein
MEDLSVSRSDASSWEKRRNLFNPSIFILIADVGLNFFRFLKSLGMSGEPNLVVLSSKDNYSCNEHELKDARIIINLKKLNLIKHLDLFLNSLVRILPPDTRFIGYFSDEKAIGGSGFNPVSLWCFLNRLINLFGSGRNHIMNRNEVMELLEKNGFKTLNMKEMNGFTYFISQNVGMPLIQTKV